MILTISSSSKELEALNLKGTTNQPPSLTKIESLTTPLEHTLKWKIQVTSATIPQWI